MNLKIVHTADLHIGYNGGVQIERYSDEAKCKIPIRVIDTFKRLETMIKFAIDEGVYAFIIAGDVFERSIVKNIYQKMFADRIWFLLEKGIHMIIITGNHDTDGQTSALSAVAKLTKGYKYLHVTEKKSLIRTAKANFYCIPYYIGIEKRIDKDLSLISEKRDFEKITIAVSHLGISGGKVGKLQIPLQTEVAPEKLRGFQYFALGDFHINKRLVKIPELEKVMKFGILVLLLELTVGNQKKNTLTMFISKIVRN